MRSWPRQVREFHEKMGLTVRDRASTLTREEALLRSQMMLEEVQEFMEAARLQDFAGMADALIDLIYFALGTFLLLGVPGTAVEALFSEVHRANMGKEVAPADGTKRRAGPGFDVVKPPGWRPPEVRRVLREHGTELYSVPREES